MRVERTPEKKNNPHFVYKRMDTRLGTICSSQTRVYMFVHKARIGYFFFPGRTCADSSTRLSWEKNMRMVGDNRQSALAVKRAVVEKIQLT